MHQLPLELVGDPITKICIYCKEEKNISEFPEHYFYKGGYDSRCKVCIKERSAFLTKVKKFATPRPDLCEIDGCENKAIACDHDPAITDPAKSFRGWLCDKHNKTLGILGDSLGGLTEQYKAYVEYLMRAKRGRTI